MLNIECPIAHQISITFFLIHPVYALHWLSRLIMHNRTNHSQPLESCGDDLRLFHNRYN